MARMIPTSIERLSETTAGERKVFKILKKTLPDDAIVRYEMLVGERDYRPDYVIIDPTKGVTIIEVKDFGIEKITKATEEQFWVRGYRGKSPPKPQINPSKKCKIYLRHAREQLQAMPLLRDETGKLAVAVEYFIAFPNITFEEFSGEEFDQLMPTEYVLFRGDLHGSGAPFRKRYNESLSTLSDPLAEGYLNEITRALFPDITIPMVTQSDFDSATEGIVEAEMRTIDTYSLSLDQEEIAKSLGEGPRLLRGIAGTGKTLIILYRAKLLAANDPNQRILILCWNTALGNYMQQAYDKFDFDAQGEVTITHFTDFVRRLLGLYKDPDFGWDDPRVMSLLASKEIPESQKYDAVYIDEAQDFRKEWIEYIFNNLIKGEPKERNMIIAADDAQRVYSQRDFTWKDLVFPMTGRSKILKTIYRNSARVWVFSAFLLEEKASYVKDSESEDLIQFSTKGGYDPQLIECRNMDEQIEKTIEITKSMLDQDLAARNVLILYRHKYIRRLGFPLVERLRKRLEEEGIKTDWIAEDASAKRSFAWDEDTVKISTVHSAKGMDSPIVIVLGAETFESEDWNNDFDEVRLMYVALTRAREFLVVLHTGEGGLVPQLKKCQTEYLKYRDNIITIES